MQSRRDGRGRATLTVAGRGRNVFDHEHTVESSSARPGRDRAARVGHRVGRARRAGRQDAAVRAGGGHGPPHDRQAHRHQAPVESRLVARQPCASRSCGSARASRTCTSCRRMDRRSRSRSRPTAQPVAGVFWSADSRTIYFTRGGTLMQVARRVGKRRARSGRAAGPERDGLARRPERRVSRRRAGRCRRRARRTGARTRRRGAGAAAGWRADTAAPAAPTTPTEIRVRPFPDGAERTVATFAGPVTGLAWTADGERLTFTSGGRRRADDPARANARVLGRQDHLHGHRKRARAAGRCLLRRAVGRPAGEVLDTAAGRAAAGAATRWLDPTHLLVDRQAPDFKRRSIFVVDTATGDRDARARGRQDHVLEHSGRRGRRDRRRRRTASGFRS